MRADRASFRAQSRHRDRVGLEGAAAGGLHRRQQGVLVVTRWRILRACAAYGVPCPRRGVQFSHLAAAGAAAHQQGGLLLCIYDVRRIGELKLFRHA
jgi:hypothetical protein